MLKDASCERHGKKTSTFHGSFLILVEIQDRYKVHTPYHLTGCVTGPVCHYLLHEDTGHIGEVFVSSVYDVPCMYVRMFVIRNGMLAGSNVCTYGVLLGIRLTEGCQSVRNKRAREQHLMCDLVVIPRFPD